MTKLGFKIIDNKGFHITFENGWTASIQIGAGNYCDNRYESNNFDLKPSTTAEVAAWDKNDVYYNFGNDRVKGYCSPSDVLGFLNMVFLLDGKL